MIMAAVPNIIVRAVPPAMTGQATGVNTLVRSVGSALGSHVAATLLASSVTAAHPLPTDDAFTLAFLLGGGGAVSAAVSAVFIPRRSGSGAAVTATTPAPAAAPVPIPAPGVTRAGGDQAD